MQPHFLEEMMLKSIGWFFGAGVAWLFILSVPIGGQKNLYQLGQHFIIRTAPVQWLGKKIVTGYEATLEATDEGKFEEEVWEVPERLSRRY